jgi:hypothetical protein
MAKTRAVVNQTPGWNWFVGPQHFSLLHCFLSPEPGFQLTELNAAALRCPHWDGAYRCGFGENKP